MSVAATKIFDPAQLDQLSVDTIRFAVEAGASQGWHRDIGQLVRTFFVARFSGAERRRLRSANRGTRKRGGRT